MRWLRRHARALIWWVAGLIGIGGILSWRRRQRALALSAADSTVVEAHTRVRELRARRATLAESSVIRAEEIGQIDQSIATHKAAIASVQMQHGLTAEEISAEFSKLGY